jgi:DNA processing protein
MFEVFCGKDNTSVVEEMVDSHDRASMLMDRQEESAYIATFGQFKGIGQQSMLRIINAFPSLDLLQKASPSHVEEKLGKRLAASLLSQLEHWDDLYAATVRSLRNSARMGIRSIPITSEQYPPLLRLIGDPPAVLHARGDITLLTYCYAVAIVGTRTPTERGREVAYAFAQRWASWKYVVVSGLAKGIDTAAHQGTLDAQGKTIAILGTPLDKIYPAENKELARRIVENGGLLLSELMVGQTGFRTAFVARDRLQSGLSLCVFPVQTSIDGGTMHTVRFAAEQKRFMICVRPAPEEESAREYDGIWSLIQRNRRCLDPARAEHFERCLHQFPRLLHKLLSGTPDSLEAESDTTQSLHKHKPLAELWE